MKPMVLDFDHSVGSIPTAKVIDLAGWQETIRFSCSMSQLSALGSHLQPMLREQQGTVFLGSGDFHHVSLPLIERFAGRGPIDVILFDNHPDNMRFPFGVHCGSWVRHVTLLPFVRHVQVMGITSVDVSAPNALANYLGPLRSGKLSYWCLEVDIRWAAMLGLDHAILRFATVSAMLDRFAEQRRRSGKEVYLSIDKDVLGQDIAQTNWDQGRMRDTELFAAIELLQGQLVGSDITGEVSTYRYSSWWKRWVSALDKQPKIDSARLPILQTQHHALNLSLLERIARAS
jgi:hypothetical protein